MKNETARREIESLDYYLQNHTDDYSEESHMAMMMAIKALEQEPCEDAISRADAEALFRNARSKLNPSDYKTADEFNTRDLMLLNAEQFIHLLPSVKPQKPKTGHWIKDDITERSKSAYKHKCDRCGAYHRAMYDYCPSCGIKMVEPQERSGEE